MWPLQLGRAGLGWPPPGYLEDGGSWLTAEELLLGRYLSLSPGLDTGQGNGMAITGLDKEAEDGMEFLANRDSI